MLVERPRAAACPRRGVPPLLALGALLVAWSWGGTAALPDPVLALAVVLCLIGFNRYSSQPLFVARARASCQWLLAVVAVGLFVPVVGDS